MNEWVNVDPVKFRNAVDCWLLRKPLMHFGLSVYRKPRLSALWVSCLGAQCPWMKRMSDAGFGALRGSAGGLAVGHWDLCGTFCQGVWTALGVPRREFATSTGIDMKEA